MSILQSLGIEPQVILAQALSFGLLLVLLFKYLYEPIESIMRQRSKTIADSLANAEAQHTRAESLRKEYEAHLANIADEAHAKLEQAMKDAEVARVRLLEQAQGEIRELHARSEAQLALDREQLRRELRTEMSDVAVQAATKALRGQMTADIQSRIVNQVITDLNRPTPPVA